MLRTTTNRVTLKNGKCLLKSNNIWSNISLWSPDLNRYLFKNVSSKGKFIDFTREVYVLQILEIYQLLMKYTLNQVY